MKHTTKQKAHYNLKEIKAEFSSVEALRLTVVARQGASEMGFTDAEIVATVQATEAKHLNKSMTSHSDTTVWQDVYNVPFKGETVYLKFTKHEGYFIISFKRK